MTIEIKVPAMGESISQALIASIIKVEGSSVLEEDELIELETDKVNQVLYAQKSGTVSWNVKVGDTVNVGETLGTIDTLKKNVEPPQEKKEIQSVIEKKNPIKEMDPNEALARYSKQDFLTEIKTDVPVKEVKESPCISSSIDIKNEPRETRSPISALRKAIGKRLTQVIQTTAMLTTFNEVDMTAVVELRNTHKESFEKKYQVRLGYMSLFIKAAVSALKAFPEINAYIDQDEMVTRHYFNIGVAVATDKGLFVPVLRDCDRLSIAEIEKSIENYAKKAKEGTLVLNDIQEGGFTITNGGTYGSLFSTPILNPPQCAILGMHKIMKRPVVINDEIVIRHMMYLALSYDHQVIDGKEAVSFLMHIKNVLEDPSRLIFEI